jgi:thiamine biosynthesis lipoprotein
MEATWNAMGGRVHVVTVGGSQADLTYAERRLAELEQLWSRFRPDSELSRLNERRSIEVQHETAAVVRLAIQAWRLTDGWFDPTVHDAVVGAGYDRSFERLRRGLVPATSPTSTPGCDGILVEDNRITLPPGVRLDLGGIGKGHAADLIATGLVERGVAGACVSLGGDMRVVGEPPAEAGTWAVAVEEPHHPEQRQTLLGLDGGAVATSSRLKRRWQSSDGESHHLIDPSNGRPATTDVVAATVVAAQASWAEIYAKVAVICGSRRGLRRLQDAGLAGLLTLSSGAAVRTESFERYEPWTLSCGGTSHAPVA